LLTDLLQTHPRALNFLHAIGVASPATQTVGIELACLARNAAGRRAAVEIGTFQGVSARVIAKALAADGKLYCIDPWDPVGDAENAVFTIAKRHFRRSGVQSRFVLLQGTSRTMAAAVPASLDFVFIDGDHSYEGLAADWEMVAPRMASGGVVCLHDTTVPAEEPHRTHGSVRYFDDAIRHDPRFRHVETVYSMNVMLRVE
jgi:predicted O-methyltransferase YrrM